VSGVPAAAASPSPSSLPASLVATLRAGRISPSYLFEGSDAEALRASALAFAAAILCRRGGCGRCRACRLARAERHPDLRVLVRDKPTVISVEALVPVLERAHQKPLEGERQVFVVDPADALEPEGVARYLKTLEEPPLGTVFVLVTTRAERLPDTVLSRCRRVRFPPPRAEDVAARLVAEGVEPDVARRAARWCAGSFARARRISTAGIGGRVDDLLDAARAEEPRVAAAATAIAKALEAAGKSEEEDEGARGREGQRVLLQDLLLALAVEARELAAERSSLLDGVAEASRATGLIEAFGSLSTAVASNVQPLVVLVEAAATLRRASHRGS
jgi:DNA polymerase-3 subunit delta'